MKPNVCTTVQYNTFSTRVSRKLVPSNNFSLVSVHLRESLPEIARPEYVHWPESHQPLWAARHAFLPEICSEKAQLREQSGCVQLWSRSSDQLNKSSLWRRQPPKEAAIFYSPLRELRLSQSLYTGAVNNANLPIFLSCLSCNNQGSHGGLERKQACF